MRRGRRRKFLSMFPHTVLYYRFPFYFYSWRKKGRAADVPWLRLVTKRMHQKTTTAACGRRCNAIARPLCIYTAL